MSRSNLVGKEFFWLTVEKEVTKPDDEKRKWLCRCICGNETVATGSNLITGNTRSCGCYKYTPKPRIDLKGKRFGFLTAIERLDSKRVLCKCLCGKEIIVSYSNLTSGNTTSCGCKLVRFIANDDLTNLTGKKFSELLVIARYVESQEKKHVKWLCLCSCGRYTIVENQKLITGHTQSCGCMKNSKPEAIIVHYLKEHNISYRKEFKFRDLTSKKGYPLRFDFMIKTQEGFFLLEYQGQQHYYNHDDFGKQQREITDRQKKIYCLKNGIELLEIRYDEDIKLAMDKIVNSHNVLHDNPVPSSM